MASHKKTERNGLKFLGALALLGFVLLGFELIVLSLSINIVSGFQSLEHLNNKNETSETSETSETFETSETSETLKTSERELLGCNDMNDIKIIRVVSKGNQKIIYEAELPSGQSIIAKRCISKSCTRKIKQEGFYLKHLQQYFGHQQTVAFYGECDIPYKKGHKETLKDIAANFTAGGYISLIELGQPLVPTWGPKEHGEEFRKCFASHFTDADLENLRLIVRQYASYPDYPLLFADHKVESNNACAEQYVIVGAGIRHIDLDQAFLCKDCTYDEAVEINCRIVRVLSHKPDLNCSLSYSLEHPVSNMSMHVSINETRDKCMAKNLTRKTDSRGKPITGCYIRASKP